MRKATPLPQCGRGLSQISRMSNLTSPEPRPSIRQNICSAVAKSESCTWFLCMPHWARWPLNWALGCVIRHSFVFLHSLRDLQTLQFVPLRFYSCFVSPSSRNPCSLLSDSPCTLLPCCNFCLCPSFRPRGDVMCVPEANKTTAEAEEDEHRSPRIPERRGKDERVEDQSL